MTKQYIALGKKLLEKGEWIVNERTKSRCLTLIDETLEYDVGNEEFPLVTTRKSYFRQAIGEMLGYIRGYTSTEQFHTLGVHTWDANSDNWNSPYKNGEGDLGVIYGKSADLVGFGFKELIDAINKTPHDRGLIWNFWNPEWFNQGCLRPCMYSHQFNVVGNKLYLSSTARSQDYPLGSVFNMVQCYFLLWLVSKLTGYESASAKLRMVNIHIYENQLELFKEQMEREPLPSPRLVCHKPITIESVLGICENPEDNLHPSDFFVEDYQHHPSIKYPFTV